MRKKPIPTLLFFGLLLIAGITLLPTDQNADASAEAVETAQDDLDQFSGWTRWSETQSDSIFDITSCNPTNSSKSILTGEVNGDGKTDLLCIYFYANGTERVFGRITNDTSYTKWKNIGEGFSHADGCAFIKVIDFDGDGDSDLACMSWHGNNDNQGGIRVELAWNAESTIKGWYTITNQPASIFDGRSCRGFYVMDINGDGSEELVCPYEYNNGSTTTFAMRFDGSLEKKNWSRVSPNATAAQFEISSCLHRSVGDVDGNGEDDLICTYFYDNGGSATFVQTADNGQLSAWTRWSNTQAANNFERLSCFDLFPQFPSTKPRSIMTGDVNGDGLTDQTCIYKYDNGNSASMVKTDNPSKDGFAYANWSNWRLVNADRFDITACQYVDIVDTNGDGMDDIVCVYRYANNGSTQTFVQESTGSGFSDWQISGPSAAKNVFDILSCISIELGDVNGDSFPDLICTYHYLNKSTATFVQFYKPSPDNPANFDFAYLPMVVR